MYTCQFILFYCTLFYFLLANTKPHRTPKPNTKILEKVHKLSRYIGLQLHDLPINCFLQETIFI
ncbi:hypothetical protein Hanom_Chr12g01164761 [Helianthus anomalus]